MIANRDYTLILDKSGSMGTEDQPGGKSRWDAVKEGTEALTRTLVKLDPDGVNLYCFNNKHKFYENVTPEKVGQVFNENQPNGSTNLADVLKDALSKFHSRKNAGQLKENGETIIVVTDGEPDDRKAVAKTIVEATKKLDKDEELAILFLQIGNDPGATSFLKRLDDELTGEGAKFDIVDVTTQEEAADLTFAQLLEKAVND